MNKLFVLLIVIILLSASNVNAWYCEDTDESTPLPYNGFYGEWGDNALLEGTSEGWLNKWENLPNGCTGKWSYSKKAYKSVKCNDYCAGYDLVEFYCDDRPGYSGDTVIFSRIHADSIECGYEVPEFGVVAAAVALVGALGVFVYKRH
jgi:hypothetical protein